MPKHQTKIRAQVLIPAIVEIPVEFDTEDGCATVTGRAVVTHHATSVSRRHITETIMPFRIDRQTLFELVHTSKQMPEPAVGSTFYLSCNQYAMEASGIKRHLPSGANAGITFAVYDNVGDTPCLHHDTFGQRDVYEEGWNEVQELLNAPAPPSRG